MTTDVQICNMALARIGHAPDKITSLAGTDTTSVLFNLFFSVTRDELLTLHDWNFATKRAALAPNTTEPIFEFLYTYDLPSDYLRIKRTNLEAEGYVTGADWRIEGNKLLSNTGPGTAKTITGATQANPVVLTVVGHGIPDGASIYVESVGGMTQINDLAFTVDNPATDTLELKGVDGSAYTAYTTGGTVKQLNIEVEYVASITDTTAWTPQFVDLMAQRLAAETAIRLTDNAQIAQSAWEVYNRKLELMRHRDAVEGTPRDIQADLWIQSRL